MTASVVVTIGKTDYRIFADGSVWSYGVHRFLRPDVDRDGYLVIAMSGHRFKVHHLVLKYFVHQRRRPGEVARHLDGKPSHNDPTNLRWGTHAQNWQDKRDHGRAPVHEKHGRAKLTWKDVHAIRATRSEYGYRQRLAAQYDVSTALIDKVRQGEIWRTEA